VQSCDVKNITPFFIFSRNLWTKYCYI